MNLSNRERWVPGYENKYFANYDGQVFRVLKTGKLRELKGYKKGNMYMVKLTRGGISIEYPMNRIVWEAFKGPIPEGYLVVRKTRVGTENSIPNLKLRTRAQHGKKTGPMSKSKAVNLLDHEGNIIDSWSSARDAAKDLFISYQTVMDYCNRKVKRPMLNLQWQRKEG